MVSQSAAASALNLNCPMRTFLSYEAFVTNLVILRSTKICELSGMKSEVASSPYVQSEQLYLLRSCKLKIHVLRSVEESAFSKGRGADAWVNLVESEATASREVAGLISFPPPACNCRIFCCRSSSSKGGSSTNGSCGFLRLVASASFDGGGVEASPLDVFFKARARARDELAELPVGDGHMPVSLIGEAAIDPTPSATAWRR